MLLVYLFRCNSDKEVQLCCFLPRDENRMVVYGCDLCAHVRRSLAAFFLVERQTATCQQAARGCVQAAMVAPARYIFQIT
jgi:hypothetical protein